MKKNDETLKNIETMKIDLERLIDSKGGLIDSEVLEYSRNLESLMNQYSLDLNKSKKRYKWLGKTR